MIFVKVFFVADSSVLVASSCNVCIQSLFLSEHFSNGFRIFRLVFEGFLLADGSFQEAFAFSLKERIIETVISISHTLDSFVTMFDNIISLLSFVNHFTM